MRKKVTSEKICSSPRGIISKERTIIIKKRRDIIETVNVLRSGSMIILERSLQYIKAAGSDVIVIKMMLNGFGISEIYDSNVITVDLSRSIFIARCQRIQI